MTNLHRKCSTKSSVAWALLSQAIWLPVFLIDTHDRWFSSSRPSQQKSLAQGSGDIRAAKIGDAVLNRIQIEKSGNGHGFKLNNQATGILLNATGYRNRSLSPLSPSPTSSVQGLPHPITAYVLPSSPSLRGLSPRFEAPPVSSIKSLHASHGLHSSLLRLDHFYSSADLLGGSISLRDLNEVDMPPVARAERAQWSRSKDPLAPIPAVWRESMRVALQGLSAQSSSQTSINSLNHHLLLRLDQARVVHVPSSKVRHTSQVPLAIQSDGTVDILSHTDDPAIVDEIKNWSSKQTLPSNGRMVPAVVHLHPLPPSDQPRKLTTSPSDPQHAQGPTHQPSFTSTSRVSEATRDQVSAPIPESPAAPVALADSSPQASVAPDDTPTTGESANSSAAESLTSSEVKP